MRRKLGEEALVVRTTTVTEGGVMGIGSKRLYEVTAAAPAPNPAARRLSAVEKKYRRVQKSDADMPVEPADPASPSEPESPPGMGATEKSLEYFEQLVRDAQERIHKPKPRQSAAPATRPSKRDVFEPLSKLKRQEPEGEKPPRSEADLRAEIAQMRDLLRVLVAERPGAGIPSDYAPYYQLLLDAGVTRELAARLVGEAAQCEDQSLLNDPQVFAERLKMRMRALFRTSGGIKLGPGSAHLVAMVGPTGVGKTTNLAKLAASFGVSERAKVGLITADTYRVAATDQLRVYANIIGLDMKIVKTPKAAAAAREALADCDLVLMDTAGGSPFNEDQMEGVKEILDAAQPDETMLLLAAGTPLDDLRMIHSRFDCLKPTSLLFTKLDETRRYGALLTMASEAGLPLSYFSIGQNVPDDIVLAHAGMVADLVMENGARGGRASTKSA